MTQIADFYGFDFETDHLLLATEFEEIPAVYVIYTPKVCLDIGRTKKLKTAIEEHEHTRDWLRLADGEEVYVAFHYDEDEVSREDIEKHLRSKMKPLL